ncbi:MAG: MFS transporter [Longimicrobiales bacterium]
MSDAGRGPDAGTGPGKPDPAVGVPWDDDPRRWGMLALVSAGLLLGMGGWFTASAVAADFQVQWALSTSQVGWLTTVVQLGFVAGTALAAVLNLADIVRARWYFAGCALLAAGANALILVVPSYETALGARFLTGFFYAGVYPPGMKMIATWFRSARGLAIGTVVGALAMGKGTPYLLKATGGTSALAVVGGASVAGLVAAALVAGLYRDGPYPFARRPFSWRLVRDITRHRPTMLATGGYLGHMWELYAMWTWLPAYLAVAAAGQGGAGGVEWIMWGVLVAGGVGCVWGGWAADRIGRSEVVNLALGVSGACCLLAGPLLGAPFWLVAPFVWVWGFFVVADSAQFSAMVTEVAPSHAVGTALTLQTSAGFLLTMASMQLVPVLVDGAGWGWAFGVLVVGPVAGLASIRALGRVRGASR